MKWMDERRETIERPLLLSEEPWFVWLLVSEILTVSLLHTTNCLSARNIPFTWNWSRNSWNPPFSELMRLKEEGVFWIAATFKINFVFLIVFGLVLPYFWSVPQYHSHGIQWVPYLHWVQEYRWMETMRVRLSAINDNCVDASGISITRSPIVSGVWGVQSNVPSFCFLFLHVIILPPEVPAQITPEWTHPCLFYPWGLNRDTNRVWLRCSMVHLLSWTSFLPLEVNCSRLYEDSILGSDEMIMIRRRIKNE